MFVDSECWWLWVVSDSCSWWSISSLFAKWVLMFSFGACGELLENIVVWLVPPLIASLVVVFQSPYGGE